MPDSLNISINGIEHSIRYFQDGGLNAFESFSDYAEDVIASLIFTACPDVTVIRCSISGYALASIQWHEVKAMVHHAVTTLKLDELGSGLSGDVSESELVDAIERIIDHLSVRVTLLARPAPSLSYSNGTAAIASLPEDRQLAILMNQLLFDGGNFRSGSRISYDDQVMRNRKSASMADVISELYDSEPVLQDLRIALIELDAKYRINQLKFSTKERAMLTTLQSADSLDAGNVLDFVRELIRKRDEYEDGIVSYPATWTQKSYLSHARLLAHSESHSNVIEEIKPHYVPIVERKIRPDMSDAEKLKIMTQQRAANLIKTMFKKV